jgi:hypothetical protein
LAYLNATDAVTVVGCAALVFHDLIPEWRAERSRVPIEIGTAGGVNALARALGQVCVSDFDIARSVAIDGFRVCSVERALLDACRILPRSVARDVVGEALRRGKTTQTQVLKTLRAGRRGGTLLRQLVNSFSAVNRDVFGRRFLELCEQAQFPAPVSEYVLDLSYGDASHIRLDFYWPTLNVAVELDGFAYHSTAADLRRDRQRQNVIIQAGITLLRYTWSDVTTDGKRTIKQLQTALSSMSAR